MFAYFLSSRMYLADEPVRALLDDLLSFNWWETNQDVIEKFYFYSKIMKIPCLIYFLTDSLLVSMSCCHSWETTHFFAQPDNSPKLILELWPEQALRQAWGSGPLALISIGGCSDAGFVRLAAIKIVICWFQVLALYIAISGIQHAGKDLADDVAKVSFCDCIGSICTSRGVWSITQWIAFLLCPQQPQVRFLAFPRIFLFMLLRYIDSSGQRLDNV